MGSSKLDKFKKEHYDPMAGDAFEAMFLRGTSSASLQQTTENNETTQETDRLDKEIGGKKGRSMPDFLPTKKNATSAVKESHNDGSKMPLVAPTPPRLPDKDRRSYESGQDLRRVTFYLSPELITALDYRSYMDKTRNKSGHIRAALETYLADDIKAVREANPERYPSKKKYGR